MGPLHTNDRYSEPFLKAKLVSNSVKLDNISNKSHDWIILFAFAYRISMSLIKALSVLRRVFLRDFQSILPR